MATKQEVADYINANVNTALTGEEIEKIDAILDPETATILIKLLATKIVAKRRLGFFNKDITREVPVVISSSSRSSKDFSWREKKATSEAEINAEHVSNKNIIRS